MNFQRTNTKLTLLEDYYSHFNEDHRLKTRHGQVEFLTTIKYINEILNNDLKKKIIDIGAGTGAYSVYYASLGYSVTAVELVKHNLDILLSKNSSVQGILGNALNLEMIEDESFDVTLLFGPMYHLLSEEEKLKALLEAKRVTKKNGVILVSYYMNEYAVISYGFIKKNILKSIENQELDENFHVINKKDDLYSMVRIEDIDSLNRQANLQRIKIIASDGPSNYLRVILNSLSDEEFTKFLEYHLSICERSDLLGASGHLLDILKK